VVPLIAVTVNSGDISDTDNTFIDTILLIHLK
jgi:hypothetical protein